MPSAKFDNRVATEIAVGMEVAQINWDGETTYVDWVIVKAVEQENGVQMIVLDNFVVQGASGGGVFLDGYHVGNNWFRGTETTADGQVLAQYTVAAMNEVGNDDVNAE